MKATSQTLSGLYDKHAGLVRTLLVTFIMVGAVVWLSIGNAVPAHALSTVSSGIEDPVMPDGSAVDQVVGAIVLRVLGVILYIVGAAAIIGAIWRLLIWVGVLSIQSKEGASKNHLKTILILLAIAGVTGASGTGLFIATSNTFGVIFGGIGS